MHDTQSSPYPCPAGRAFDWETGDDVPVPIDDICADCSGLLQVTDTDGSISGRVGAIVPCSCHYKTEAYSLYRPCPVCRSVNSCLSNRQCADDWWAGTWVDCPTCDHTGFEHTPNLTAWCRSCRGARWLRASQVVTA
ncbi:hypothetical protein ACIBI4_34065 [Streptomyces sp. NPDC050418]|uniref:hypothetical protein n=1 Tax=Streptomyces sp. NPDC050418 TaxID=3365612 RepID=UPI003790FB85